MYRVILAVVLAALAGCQTVAAPKAKTAAPSPSLQAKLVADLNQAIADNGKATDARAPIRLQCWQTLLGLVPEIPSLPGGIQYDAPKAGIFDAVERAGAFIEDAEDLADAQIPDEVLIQIEQGCGAVALRARGLRDRFAIRFVRIGARIGILPVP